MQNHWRKQSACRQAVTEFQPVRNQPFHAQIFSQRAHHVIQPLADQYNFFAPCQRFFQLGNAFGFQLWFQIVVKVLFAEQIQSVAADPT